MGRGSSLVLSLHQDPGDHQEAELWGFFELICCADFLLSSCSSFLLGGSGAAGLGAAAVPRCSVRARRVLLLEAVFALQMRELE